LVPLQQIDPGTMALVVAVYETQYPDPLTMDVGDDLKIVKTMGDEWPGWVFCESKSGKRGWVPENGVMINGDSATAQKSYVAREVTVMEGEIVRIENVESGWAWVTNMTDQTGWVPLKNLKIVE
jgi:Variant SH3 domain